MRTKDQVQALIEMFENDYRTLRAARQTKKIRAHASRVALHIEELRKEFETAPLTSRSN